MELRVFHLNGAMHPMLFSSGAVMRVLRCIGLQVTANLTQGLTNTEWALQMLDSAPKWRHQRHSFFSVFLACHP